ncbi:MAG: hypothetical protein ACM3UU_10745 [Ignavibacteriales bacterium]
MKNKASENARKLRIKQKQEEARKLRREIDSYIAEESGNLQFSDCSIERSEIIYSPAFVLFTTPENDGQPEANIGLFVPQEVYGDKVTREEIASLVTSSKDILAETYIDLMQYECALSAQKTGSIYEKSEANGFCFFDMICLSSRFWSLKWFTDEVLEEIIKTPELLAKIIMDDLWKVGQEFGKSLKNA